MAYKEGRFADILPSQKEQAEQIAIHQNLYKFSLKNTYQVLTPPLIKTQKDWPTRVTLNSSPQTIPIEIPRKAPFFHFENLLIHYPADLNNDVPSPPIKIMVTGTDRIYLPREQQASRPATGGVDALLFTSPGTDPQPANSGDQGPFIGALPFDILLDSETEFSIVVFGFDGTNPEWIDIAVTGRMYFNRSMLGRF